MGNTNAKNASDVETEPSRETMSKGREPMSTAIYKPHLSPLSSPTQDPFFTPPVSPDRGQTSMDTVFHSEQFDSSHKGVNSVIMSNTYEKVWEVPFDRAIKSIQQASDALDYMHRQLGELLTPKTNTEVPRIIDSALGWETRLGDVRRDLRVGLKDLGNLKDEYLAQSRGDIRTDRVRALKRNSYKEDQVKELESARLEWKREEERLQKELQERGKLALDFSNRLTVLELRNKEEKAEKQRLLDRLSQLDTEKEQMVHKVTELQGTVEDLNLLQSDLRTAVSVAERFREEAQQKLERAERENQRLRAKGADVVDGKCYPDVNGSSLGYRSLPRGVILSSTTDPILKSRSLMSVPPLNPEAKQKDQDRRRSMEGIMHEPRPTENLIEDSGSFLRRYGGSKRGVFLRWAQERTLGYKFVVITNFSSSWVDGMAFCALLHSYLPNTIPYAELRPLEKRKNLQLAFLVAEREGIPCLLTPDHMLQAQGPDWQKVLLYVESIYQKFEA